MRCAPSLYLGCFARATRALRHAASVQIAFYSLYTLWEKVLAQVSTHAAEPDMGLRAVLHIRLHRNARGEHDTDAQLRPPAHARELPCISMCPLASPGMAHNMEQQLVAKAIARWIAQGTRLHGSAWMLDFSRPYLHVTCQFHVLHMCSVLSQVLVACVCQVACKHLVSGGAAGDYTHPTSHK